MLRLDYVLPQVGPGRSPGPVPGGIGTEGDAIAMAARGVTLGDARRPGRRSRRTLAVAASVLLSIALAAGAYGTLTGSGSTGRPAPSRAFKQAGLLSLPLAARGPVS